MEFKTITGKIEWNSLYVRQKYGHNPVYKMLSSMEILFSVSILSRSSWNNNSHFGIKLRYWQRIFSINTFRSNLCRGTWNNLKCAAILLPKRIVFQASGKNTEFWDHKTILCSETVLNVPVNQCDVLSQ